MRTRGTGQDERTLARRATVAITAVMVGMLLLAAEPAAAAPVRGVERVCPPPAEAADADPSFPDLGATHAAAIGCAAEYGLVGGFGDGTYRPSAPVSRGQTASAVAAWVELAMGFPLDPPDQGAFTDQGTTHGDAIASLAEVGIVTGRPDGTFGPEEPLTRGQFARIMVRAISYADVFRVDGPLPPVPPSGEAGFADIAASLFTDDIRALAATGVTTGVEPDRFAPEDRVTRGQLASFLMRAADYLDRHQRWKPTAVVVTFLTRLEPVDDPTGGSEVDADDLSQPDTAEERASLAALSATVVINAFNGTIGYLLEISALEAPLPEDVRLTLRLGTREDPGPVVVVLADARELEAALDTGIATGTRVEADSSVRLADLLLSDANVMLELEDAPGGTYRGELARTG